MSFLNNLLKELGVNHSFFIQLFSLFISYIFLSNFVFKPIGRILKRRKYSLVGRQKITEKILLRLKNEHDEYDEKWSKKEKELFKSRDRRLLDAKNKSKIKFEKEIKNQKIKLLKGREKLEEEKDLLLKDLSNKMNKYSKKLIEKIERF